MHGGTYIILNNKTGSLYVGSAKSFKLRWKTHLKELRTNKHINIHLQRSFNKHGESAFEFKEHETLGMYNRDFYFQKENELMLWHKEQGKSLYNIAMAQGGWSYHDDETKRAIGKKISLSLKLTMVSLSAAERKDKFAYWSKNKHYPDDARNQISLKLTGISRSVETREKMKAAQALLADSKRASMAEVGKKNKGRAPSNKGQKASDETRLKQRLVKLGTSMCEEQKAKRRGKPAANRKPVLIEGIEFSSMSAAAKHFNKSMTWIYNMLEKHDRKEITS